MAFKKTRNMKVYGMSGYRYRSTPTIQLKGDWLKEIGFDTNKTALVCGPPIMIKFVLAGLEELGFSRDQVYTTLELRMKCGVGKCGRCNIGDKYVCKDGPVFRCDEIDELPSEY